MRRILSFLLTAAMLLGIAAIPAVAEGNACLVYTGSGMGSPAGQSPFTAGYFYIEEPCVYRDGTNPVTSFDYTVVFDLYIEDYTVSPTTCSGFGFSFEVSEFYAGYDFAKSAFVVDNRYMMNMANPEDITVWASAGYELQKNTWYEIGYKTVGTVISMYVNGILVLSYDLLTCPDSGFTWSLENDVALGRWDGNDFLFFSPYECDIRVDNMSITSGDYDFGTGTATETFYNETAPALDGTTISFCGFKGGTESTWFNYSADKGTDKVTYDRDYAASHVHDLQVTEHYDATCLTDGYDWVQCECGMGYKTNVVAALGHLPGIVNSATPATEVASGVENRICNRCYESYTVVTPATTTAANCLYLQSKGSTAILNGYTAINRGEFIELNDGATVSLDIMPAGYIAEKPYAGMGANFGSPSHRYWIGYSYALEAFAITPSDADVTADECYAINTDVKLAQYEWANWVFQRRGTELALYINDELVVSYTVPEEDFYGDQNDDGIVEAGENGQFLFNSHAAHIYMDNFIVAGPEYDVATNTGVIYDYLDFNDKTTNGSESALAGVILYDASAGTGYTFFNGGRPMEDQIHMHRDTAIKFEDDFGGGNVGGQGYAQLTDDEADSTSPMQQFMAGFNAGALDFQYTYSFNASEWCTDEAVLNGATAFIGGYVNTEAIDSTSAGGAAGYDFIRQQVVIGALDGMYHTNFATDDNGDIIGAAVDYEVKAGEWYEMTVSYKSNEDFSITVSVAMNGIEIASYTYDYINISFFIFYPSNVNCLIDNDKIVIAGNVVYESDYTNAWNPETDGMSFSGPGYSIVEGGIDTHVYTETKYPASCLTDGYTVYVCSCGESEYTLYNLEAPGHSWDDGVVTLEPTTESTGIKTFTCGVCGDSYEEEIPMLEPEYTLGDVTGDGAINASDVTPLKRVIASLTTNYVEKAADITGDGSINAMDLQVLVRYCAGLSTVLS